MILQLIAAFGGTVAFALLFSVPKKYYLTCGLTGLSGWAIYLLCTELFGLTPAEATFPSAAAVMVLSRIATVRTNCPVTVFGICGIFPLIPGGSFYRCIYAIVIGDSDGARSAGMLAAKVIFALVVGIVLIQDLPDKLFSREKKKINADP